MSDPSFVGKVAVVTGGGSGIGAATARRLAVASAQVIVADVDEAAGRAVAAEIGGTFTRLDVSRPDDWTRLVAEASAVHGGIDLAHLNAGIALGAYPVVVEELSDEDYRRSMGVNVDGVVFGVRALVPILTARGGGAIVVTASLAGIGPHPDDPLYCATKHFAIGLVRSLGRPLREHGITINAVCPGAVDTPLLDTTGRRDAIAARGQPLMTGDDIANAVVALLGGTETAQAYTVMAGRGAERFQFPSIPGMPGR